MKPSPNGTNSPKSAVIRDVYEDNFISEMKQISSLLDEYNYIGMDTEFPGTCFKLSSYSEDFYYRSIKKNADELKLIQLGITLCNSKGEYPPLCSTWQFNFHFDLKTDTFSQDSITLLMNSGINFEMLKTKGIPHHLFAEYFIAGGLILNPNIHWISYHGSSDFAYLLRLALNTPLPQEESEFTAELEVYFPNHFDIKVLINGKEQFKGGLNKLAQCLDICRTGEVHQAGSDSVVTVDLFFALLSNKVISSDSVLKMKNVIYGIGEGEDNKETINYIAFEDNAIAMKNEFEQKANNSNVNGTNFGGVNTSSQSQQSSFNGYTQNAPTTPTHSINNRNNVYYPYMGYGKQNVNVTQSNYMMSNNNKGLLNANQANAMPPLSPIPNINNSSGQMNGNGLFRNYYNGYV